jgi:hypothetical protein
MIDFFEKVRIIVGSNNSRPKSSTGYFYRDQLNNLLESKPLSLMFGVPRVPCYSWPRATTSARALCI